MNCHYEDALIIPYLGSSHWLVRLFSGKSFYSSTRVDRKEGGSNTHMINIFEIVEAFDKYRGSMERIGRAISARSVLLLSTKHIYFFNGK